MNTTTNWLIAAAVVAGMGASVAHARDARDGVFILQTALTEAAGKCFDGGARDSKSPAPAAMQACRQTQTQTWYAEPADKGYFKLKTAAASDRCLEGQDGPGNGKVLDGAAFLDTCSGVSGQLWKAVAVGDGAEFKLMNAFAGDRKCLEGNGPGADSVLGGNAFMDTCQNVSGQLWSIGGGQLADGIPTANR